MGWSIIDQYIPFVEGIHHPLGDVQKYLAGTAPEVFTYTIGTANYYYYKYNLSDGIYELTSSGSPVLNDSRRVIGAFSARLPSAPMFSCAGPNLSAVAGRLSWSWPQFCQYLDPDNEGIVALNTIINTPAPKVFPNAHGPDLMCSSGNFILMNAPLDLPVSWEIVQGTNLVNGPYSGTGKQVSLTQSGSSSGQAKIRFTVQNICGTKQYEKTFQVGRINSAETTVTGTAGVCPGNQYTYYANVPGGHKPGYVYQWTYPSNWSVQTQSANFITLYVPTYNPDYGTVSFRVNNGCGYSDYSGITVYPGYNCSSGMYNVNVYPNPVSDELNLVMIEEDGKKIKKEKTIDVEFEISLFDVKGYQISSFKTKETEITIDVRKLKNGFYYLHILYKEGLIRKQIRVER